MIFRVFEVALGLGIGLVAIVIVSGSVLHTQDGLLAPVLGSFTGSVAFGGLLPVVLLGLGLYGAWGYVRRGDG